MNTFDDGRMQHHLRISLRDRKPRWLFEAEISGYNIPVTSENVRKKDLTNTSHTTVRSETVSATPSGELRARCDEDGFHVISHCCDNPEKMRKPKLNVMK